MLAECRPLEVLVLHVVSEEDAAALHCSGSPSSSSLPSSWQSSQILPKWTVSPICLARQRTWSAPASVTMSSSQAPKPLTGCGLVRNRSFSPVCVQRFSCHMTRFNFCPGKCSCNATRVNRRGVLSILFAIMCGDAWGLGARQARHARAGDSCWLCPGKCEFSPVRGYRLCLVV